MKYIKRFTTHILLLALLLLPVVAMADTGVAVIPPPQTEPDAGTTPTQQQMIRQWHYSGDFQTQIATLPTIPAATFPIPVLFGVGVKNLSPNFGIIYANGCRHIGEDIMALKGTPIVSPTAAVVSRISLGAATGASEGNAVYTINPGGESFVYYHLDHVAEGLATGQLLSRGSLIGYVGDTGDAAGRAPHLHFEVHDSTQGATDPFPRLAEEFSIQEKISYLSAILTQTADPVALSQFLVSNFRSTFTLAQASNISLPLKITEALAVIPGSTVPKVAGVIYLPPGELNLGSSGALVVNLQTYLIGAAAGPAAARLTLAGATGNFGALTQAALIEFQTKMGIIPSNGYYGPSTQTFILAHQVTALLPVVTTHGLFPVGCASTTGFSPITGVNCATGPPGPPGPTTSTRAPTLSRDLSIGISGQDVLTLQKLLNTHGYIIAVTGGGSPGNETTFFGSGTRAAVIKFQTAHNITPAAGYVGPITRTALASL